MAILKISKQITNTSSRTQILSWHSGFLLIELLVSLMLLLFFMYLMQRYQGKIIEVKQAAIKRYEVSNLIASFLAKLSVNSTMLKQTTYSYNDITLHWEATENSQNAEQNFPELSLSPSKLKNVIIKAAWNINNSPHTMIICTGIKV